MHYSRRTLIAAATAAAATLLLSACSSYPTTSVKNDYGITLSATQLGAPRYLPPYRGDLPGYICFYGVTATNDSGKDTSPINVQLQRSGDGILYGMLLTKDDKGPDASTPGIDGYRDLADDTNEVWLNDSVFAAGQTVKFLAVLDCTDKKLKSKKTTLGDKAVTLPISR